MSAEDDEIDQTTAEGYMLKAGQDPDEARRRFEANRTAIARKGEPPSIVTTANPSSEMLQDARRLLNQEGRVRNFVALARQQGLDRDAAVDGLAIRLNIALGGAFAAETYEAAQFLWDEQDQLGDGLYVVSRETGRVAGVVTEADFYQPAPVPREDGTLAWPQLRLRPEIESALVCRAFDTGREAQLLAQLTERAQQTDLLREDGDPRLLVATKAGRRHVVESFAAFDPQVLLRAAGGTSGAFLQRFQLTSHDPSDVQNLTLVEGVALSTTTTSVADPLTLNLRHNRAASMMASQVQGWVREMARQLSLAMPAQAVIQEARPRDLTSTTLGESDFWVSPPDAIRFVQRAAPTAALMPVTGANLMGVRPMAGTIVVPPAFEALSREMFDRWEARSNMTFRIWVDWTQIKGIRLIDLEHQASPV